MEVADIFYNKDEYVETASGNKVLKTFNKYFKNYYVNYFVFATRLADKQFFVDLRT